MSPTRPHRSASPMVEEKRMRLMSVKNQPTQLHQPVSNIPIHNKPLQPVQQIHSHRLNQSISEFFKLKTSDQPQS
jgi:hypothetical protein